MKSQYAAAVLSPFSPAAKGARVPDSYAFPTETETFQAKFNVETKNIYNYNWFDLVFKCSLLDTLTTPALQGGTQDTSFQNNTKTSKGALVVPSGTPPNGYEAKWGSLTANGFINSDGTVNNKEGGSQKWSKYRIVGAGIRMKSMMIPDKTTGYINFYSNPNSKVDYSTDLFQATDFTLYDNRALMTTHTGRPYVRTVTPLTFPALENSVQPYSVVLNETMSQEPTGALVDSLTFNAKGCEFAFRPITAEAYEWRNMTSAPIFSNNVEDTLFNQDGGAVTQVNFAAGSTGVNTKFDESFYSTAGWNNLCVKGVALGATGAPLTDTTTTPICVVEVIYHVEYISAQINNSNHASYMPYDQGLLDSVAYRASKQQMYRQLYSSSDAYTKIKRRNGF